MPEAGRMCAKKTLWDCERASGGGKLRRGARRAELPHLTLHLRCRVQGAGYRVQGSGSKVQGSGFAPHSALAVEGSGPFGEEFNSHFFNVFRETRAFLAEF